MKTEDYSASEGGGSGGRNRVGGGSASGVVQLAKVSIPTNLAGLKCNCPAELKCIGTFWASSKSTTIGILIFTRANAFIFRLPTHWNARLRVYPTRPEENNSNSSGRVCFSSNIYTMMDSSCCIGVLRIYYVRFYLRSRSKGSSTIN